MDVTFLGTGSAMPTGERAQTGIVVSEGRDRVLIDCGSGVLQRLQQYGPGYERISTVLLTHRHLDHVADLLPLCKARWLAGETELTIVGVEGTEALVDDLFDTHAYMKDRLDLTVRDIGPGTHEIGGLTVEATQTQHSVACLAYRFGDQFAFSGDSEAFPELATLFDEVAVGAHDCSFPDGVDVSNHPTPTSLGEAFAEATPDLGRLYLTHFYPHAQGEESTMAETVQEYVETDVRVAEDGLTVSIKQH